MVAMMFNSVKRDHSEYSEYCRVLNGYVEKLKKIKLFKDPKGELDRSYEKTIFSVYKSYIIPLIEYLNGSANDSTVENDFELTTQILSDTVTSLDKASSQDRKLMKEESNETLFEEAQKIRELRNGFLSSKEYLDLNIDRKIVELKSNELFEILKTFIGLKEDCGEDIDEIDEWSSIAKILNHSKDLPKSIDKLILEFDTRIENLESGGCDDSDYDMEQSV